MKFFTVAAWQSFDDDPQAFQRVYQSYQRRLQQLAGVLPDRVLELSEPYGIENGLITRVRHDENRRKLQLTIRCGHLQMGYYDLALTYREAEISPEHDRVLASIARSTISARRHDAELFYQEIDLIDDGRMEHRLFFIPGIWISVRCEDLDWARVPRRDRRLPWSADRYPGGPESFALKPEH